MKKIYTVLLFMAASLMMKSASYTVTIVGTSYSVATLTVNVGDVITIQASGAHPLVQVDQTVWTAGGTTSLSGGFGVQNSNYTFTASTQGMIYYVCQIHASMGMKGSIQVNPAAGLNEFNYLPTALELFPNPASESAIVRSSVIGFNPQSIRITNIQGAVVADVQVVNDQNALFEQRIKLPAHLSSGIYFVNIQTTDAIYTRKLIIQ